MSISSPAECNQTMTILEYAVSNKNKRIKKNLNHQGWNTTLLFPYITQSLMCTVTRYLLTVLT